MDGATPLKIAAARGNVQKLGKEPGLAASASGDSNGLSRPPKNAKDAAVLHIDVLFPFVGWLIEGFVYPFNR